jgi:hypothetical protein
LRSILDYKKIDMKKSVIAFLIIILFGFVSCGPYGSRAFHVAQLDEKGDFQAGGYISPATGLELQADYAWGDRFYSPADFSYSIIQSGDNGFRSNAYSLGLGYYKRMRGAGRFDVYITPMYGNYGNTGSDNKSHFFSQAIGSDLGWRFKHFEAAFSMKVENFSFFDDNWNFDGKATTLGSGMTMRFGGERLKFHMQIGLSYPVSGTVDVFPYVMNLGINYRLKFRR